MQMGPLAGRFRRFSRAPWWIRQLAPAPGPSEKWSEAGGAERLRGVPQSFPPFSTGDRQRWVEERRKRRERERGRWWARTARIIDDPFVCFVAKDFESIAARVVVLPSSTASAR